MRPKRPGWWRKPCKRFCGAGASPPTAYASACPAGWPWRTSSTCRRAADKTQKLVEFEVGLQFNLPVEQLVWDFHAFNGGPEKGTGPICAKHPSGGHQPKVGRGKLDLSPSPAGSGRALLVAAKRHLVRRFLESLRHAGLRADLLQPDFIALHNFLAFEHFAAAGKGDSPHLPAAVEDAAAAKPPPVAAALDVGGDMTSLIVSSPQSLWFHSCGVAGRSFTRALVKELNLSVAQAEQLKRAPESAPQIGPFQQALAPVFDDLLREVRQSLAVYAQAEPGRPVGQLFGLGGGFALHGMFRYFRCGR